MIRDLEDKMFRGDEDHARRLERMERYRDAIRARFRIEPPLPRPVANVETAAQPPCEACCVDTRTIPE